MITLKMAKHEFKCCCKFPVFEVRKRCRVFPSDGSVGTFNKQSFKCSKSKF